MSGYEINLRHFLPNQKVISQMNHTAMNNLIWTTNSQSFSYFQNLKVCRTMFDFCVHALLRSNVQNFQNLIFQDQAYLFLRQIPGTPPYWQKFMYEVIAMVKQLGIPTWFMTLS